LHDFSFFFGELADAIQVGFVECDAILGSVGGRTVALQLAQDALFGCHADFQLQTGRGQAILQGCRMPRRTHAQAEDQTI